MSFDTTFNFAEIKSKATLKTTMINSIFPTLVECDVPGSLNCQKKDLNMMLSQINAIECLDAIDKDALYNQCMTSGENPHEFMAKMINNYNVNTKCIEHKEKMNPMVKEIMKL